MTDPTHPSANPYGDPGWWKMKHGLCEKALTESQKAREGLQKSLDQANRRILELEARAKAAEGKVNLLAARG